MTDVADLPAPLVADAPPEKVTFQHLFDMADSERMRAETWAGVAEMQAESSDQQSERERDTSRRVMRSQRQRAEVFRAMALLLARVSASGVIKKELTAIAKREAEEAAARAAEDRGEGKSDNE